MGDKYLREPPVPLWVVLGEVCVWWGNPDLTICLWGEQCSTVTGAVLQASLQTLVLYQQVPLSLAPTIPLCFCEFDICTCSVTRSFQSAGCPQPTSGCRWQDLRFRLRNPLCVCTSTVFIHSPLNEHFSCFRILEIMLMFYFI